MKSEIFQLQGVPVIVDFIYLPMIPSRHWDEPDTDEEIEIHTVLFNGVDVSDILTDEQYNQIVAEIRSRYA